MTEFLRDTFGELVRDEPPMRLDVPGVLAHGRRRRARRRWLLSGAVAVSVAAALVPVLALAHLTAPRDPGVTAGRTTLPASATPSLPPSAPPGSSSASSAAPPVSPPVTPPVSSSAPVSGAPGVGGTEGLADPGFEAEPVSWDRFGPATTLTATATVHGGARAVRIVTTATARSVAGATSRPVRVTTEAGARYTASCWVRATGPLDAYVQVQEYTTGWVRDADPVKSARVTLTDPGAWRRLTVTYTAARSGNLLPLTVFGADMTAGGAALLADDCSLRRL